MMTDSKSLTVSSATQRFPASDSSARSRLLRDPAFRPHFIILALIVMLNAILRINPEWAMGLSYQCLMKSVFHLKCPFCGMTRDFAAILRGHPPELNPFSWAAVVFIYCVYPVAVVWACLRGRADMFQRPMVYKVLAVTLLVMFVVNNLQK